MQGYHLQLYTIILCSINTKICTNLIPLLFYLGVGLYETKKENNK